MYFNVSIDVYLSISGLPCLRQMGASNPQLIWDPKGWWRVCYDVARMFQHVPMMGKVPSMSFRVAMQNWRWT